ncbi:MAG: helix-turn-helix transcriptional regulator [Butyrivibrio sp.]|nr:helix-turn-helix transcriptional regulator [Butyrivibrio sp.]
MNQYVTGSVIKDLREKDKITQSQLADMLGVSDKAISKWEIGRGYPEARFKLSGVKKIFFYCNKDGLYEHDVVRGIDDRDRFHDDTQERRELEETVKRLFG